MGLSGQGTYGRALSKRGIEWQEKPGTATNGGPLSEKILEIRLEIRSEAP
jgi:hypothetical protein